MKIGILTQPLHANYGGILQNYALQVVINRLGHEVITLNRDHWAFDTNRGRGFLIEFVHAIKRLLFPVKHKENVPQEKYDYIWQLPQSFIKKYIQITDKIYTTEELKQKSIELDINAFVVGSDQVWRPKYSPLITNYFLDFTKGLNVKRIAFAASFGVDYWEYPSLYSRICRKLAYSFNAVSVREDSGITLCKEHFGLDAEQVLDPTMLLDKEDYIDLITIEKEDILKGGLFCYILDMNPRIQDIIGHISNKLDIEAYYCMPKQKLCIQNMDTQLDNCVFPSVTQWLRSFLDADIVLADSFHGIVFSIIFNKPFWVIGNKDRGLARFSSLLKLFDLEDRFIDLSEIKKCDFHKPINWVSVNSRKKELQTKSIDFLIDALNVE